MLYVLHGENFRGRADKLDELVSFFLAKKPNTALVKINQENFPQFNLDELCLTRGLFEQRSVVVLHDLISVPEIKEALLEKIPAVSESENIFILSEYSIGKGDESFLKKHAEKIQEFSSEEKPAPARFNVFTLADAVGLRDKKRAWVALLKAFENGLEPEEIHGTLFWQVKNMALVKEVKEATAESTGLKPFVLSKAKAFSGNYSNDELRGFSSRLVSLYHDSHRGMGDFAVGLEKLILETL